MSYAGIWPASAMPALVYFSCTCIADVGPETESGYGHGAKVVPLLGHLLQNACL
jgi:hypothetical protein